MSNPSESSLKEHGSMTVAEILEQVDAYAREVGSAWSESADSPAKLAAKLERRKLELMLQLHFGSTEPFATLRVAGGFISTQIHGDTASLTGDVPLYRAPQMQGGVLSAMRSDERKRLEALEEFFKAYHEFARCNVELTQLQTKMQKCAKDCA